MLFLFLNYHLKLFVLLLCSSSCFSFLPFLQLVIALTLLLLLPAGTAAGAAAAVLPDFPARAHFSPYSWLVCCALGSVFLFLDMFVVCFEKTLPALCVPRSRWINI